MSPTPSTPIPNLDSLRLALLDELAALVLRTVSWELIERCHDGSVDVAISNADWLAIRAAALHAQRLRDPLKHNPSQT